MSVIQAPNYSTEPQSGISVDQLESPEFSAYAIVQLPSIYTGGLFTYRSNGSVQLLTASTSSSSSTNTNIPINDAHTSAHRLDNTSVLASKWCCHIYGHIADAISDHLRLYRKTTLRRSIYCAHGFARFARIPLDTEAQRTLGAS